MEGAQAAGVPVKGERVEGLFPSQQGAHLVVDLHFLHANNETLQFTTVKHTIIAAEQKRATA